MARRISILLAAGTFLLTAAVGSADAAPLPDNCKKVQGQVTCTTFEGPGNNQAGVGETTVTETQGNTTNKSPDPQELEDSDSCSPPSSNGRPCNP